MRRTPTLALLTVALLLLSMGIAQASVVVRDDNRGDAPAAIDIAKARYAYGDGRVTVLATIPRLGRSGVATLSISRFEIFEAGYVVRIAKKVGEPARVSLHYFDHFKLNRRTCPGVAGTWNDQSISLRVPATCLKDDATPRVFAQFGIQRDGSVDRAPAVKRLARD